MERKKRKRRIEFLVILFLGVFPLISIHHIAQAAPVADLAESTFSFGSAVEGTKIKHEFVLKNEGTDTLVIDKIRTG